MVTKKPRIVIIGAGMAGLTAAHKLYTATATEDLFELFVVEGGTRIGGRISTSEFCGDRIEMGATWIHGIEGSPIHKIAQDINSLQSEQPWECMDGLLTEPTTVAEGGFELNQSFVKPVTALFKNLMDYAQGKLAEQCAKTEADKYGKLVSKNFTGNGGVANAKLSLGSFLRQGLQAYLDSAEEKEELKGYGDWSRKSLVDAVFAMHENTQRTYTSAGDLFTLDYDAESEYHMFPGEEITIAKGYSSVIESLASVLPTGTIRLGRKVTKIEWQPERHAGMDVPYGYGTRPVKLHFSDRSVMSADHVIVTVSLGVLKAGVHEDSGMFSPLLPSSKVEAISRLGFGVVNKLFLQLSPSNTQKDENSDSDRFPCLEMVLHPPDSELRCKKIPWWIRRTASLSPIYNNSKVLLAWFAGEEALQLELLQDEEIIGGVSTTVSSFLTRKEDKINSQKLCNGNLKSCKGSKVQITKVLKSQWGTNPLFLGSYSYVSVGSSGIDFDTMAEPLPRVNTSHPAVSPPLQILFAGEATHRTHYSTTHGAYFSGLREAERLLQHYQCMEI